MKEVYDPRKGVSVAAPGWSLNAHSMRQGIKLAHTPRRLHTERFLISISHNQAQAAGYAPHKASSQS